MGNGGFRPLFRRLVHLFIRIVFDFSSGGVSSATSYGGLSGEPLPRITLCSARPFGRKEAEGSPFTSSGNNKLETLTEKRTLFRVYLQITALAPPCRPSSSAPFTLRLCRGCSTGIEPRTEAGRNWRRTCERNTANWWETTLKLCFPPGKKNKKNSRSRRKAAWRSSLIRSWSSNDIFLKKVFNFSFYGEFKMRGLSPPLQRRRCGGGRPSLLQAVLPHRPAHAEGRGVLHHKDHVRRTRHHGGLQGTEKHIQYLFFANSCYAVFCQIWFHFFNCFYFSPTQGFSFLMRADTELTAGKDKPKKRKLQV